MVLQAQYYNYLTRELNEMLVVGASPNYNHVRIYFQFEKYFGKVTSNMDIGYVISIFLEEVFYNC